MRNTFLWLALCALIMTTATGGVSAYTSYATATGKTCGYCHIDTRGGGPLTAAGQYYFDNGTLPPDAPSAPTSLAASAVSQSQINLTWNDNSTTETGFKVERGATATGPFALIATLPAGAKTYSNTGLTASTTYYYRVYAFNGTGNSAYTAVASAKTLDPPPAIPSAPSALAAFVVSQSQINLTWNDNSTTETGFKVERGASASGPFALIATLPAGATAFSNTGLTASTTYYYRVYSFNATGNSAYTAVVSAKTLDLPPAIPSAPSALAASVVSQSQINLTWSDNSTTETGFKIERGASATGPFTEIGRTSAGVATYSDTGLAAAATYYYRVRSYVAGVANSAYSNTASAKTMAASLTVPSAPTALAAAAVSQSQINLSWTDASSNESGFKIERATSAIGPFVEIGRTLAGVATYSDTGLSAGVTYYYRVRSYVAGIANSAYSNTASAKTLAPPPTVPSTPTGLAASAVSQSQINLTWTDTSSNESGFKIERATSATGPFVEIGRTLAGVSNYSDTGLTAGITYYYRVRSYIAGVANGGYSNTASAKTSALLVKPQERDDDDIRQEEKEED